MKKREETLLKIVGCLTFFISNSAYLQQYCLAKLENPTVGKYNLEGIFKYNRSAMDEIGELLKEVDNDSR